MQKILVTGANGFVGRALCSLLLEKGYVVRGAVRSAEKSAYLPNEIEVCVVDEIGPDTDWEKAMQGVDVIVHLAARVHVIGKSEVDSSLEYNRINALGTEQLARLAAKHKISRLIYLSSVKVNGEYTVSDSKGAIVSFSEEDAPNPRGYYALSKWKAELALQRIKEEAGLEIVILRAPLVYGPGVKANFLSLLKIVDFSIPLPLANIKNLRSFIYLGNLTDIILKCISEPMAAGHTFLVSDGRDISTPDLIREIAITMGRSPKLFPAPTILLKSLGMIIGRFSEIERLIRSLCINNNKISKILDWKPFYTLDQGIKLTIDSYLCNTHN